MGKEILALDIVDERREGGENEMKEQNGLTVEKIDKLAVAFYEKIMEKMETQDFQTEMVHEDIRIMHHLAALKRETIALIPTQPDQ